MPTLSRTRTRGARDATSPSLHLLVGVLLALQLAGPVVVALWDPAPTPVAHTDHIAPDGDSSCAPFHDDGLCLTCRVLSLQPLHPESAPSLPPLAVGVIAALPDFAHALPGTPADAPLGARAPPRT